MGKFDLSKLFGRKKQALGGMTITISPESAADSLGAISGTGAATTSEIRQIPFIGRMSVKSQYTLVGSILLATLVVAAGLTFYATSQKGYYTAHYKSVQDIRTDLLAFNQDTLRIASGLDAFLPGAYLERQKIDDGFSFIRNTVFKDLPELTGGQRVPVERAFTEWSKGRADFAELADAHAAALSLRGKLTSSVKPLTETLTQARALLSLSSLSADQAIQAGVLVDALEKTLDFAQTSEANVSYGSSALKFKNNMLLSQKGVAKLKGSALPDDARIKTDIIDKQIAAFVPATLTLLNALRGDEYRPAATRAEVLTEKVLLLTDDAESSLRDKISSFDIFNYIASGLVILMLVCILLLGIINNNESKRRTIEARGENEANQRAIMALLDEVGDLAQGDLTVRASVSEEITGAIADSMNFAITEMATLVGQTKSASSRMDHASIGAKMASGRLQKINLQQTRDITETGQSVLQIAESISQVSQRMEDTEQVARASVESSNRGMESVNNSIQGIRTIQQNVEETGKRIRRLTDQSKLISEIVDVISDISERTSVLAINATVQATKAGEAGKGFRVVADSVQELAGQASEATRRVGALVNAIQTDISGAGLAMDKTTEEANRGAQLAEVTGEVLAEISNVSMALADIVVEVNEQVGASAKAASSVSKTMKQVLDSVSESGEASKATGDAIDEMGKLSEQLRDSVSGFKV